MPQTDYQPTSYYVYIYLGPTYMAFLYLQLFLLYCPNMTLRSLSERWTKFCPVCLTRPPGLAKDQRLMSPRSPDRLGRSKGLHTSTTLHSIRAPSGIRGELTRRRALRPLV
ncbi:hypothetical protein K523DRAFT_98691 [Schizophyllum commune Tattone D]|nr:hypothetical protein K523DRAFT_98691 [Schizophyllum commune Tattone D]